MCFLVLLAFLSLTAAKPPPTPSPWAAAYGKSAGPPFGSPGMGVIGVPYMPKTSPFFPKFVDPAAMISKKTSMLSNLFGGLGPMDYAPQTAGDFSPFSPRFGPSAPVLYSPEANDFSSGLQGFGGKGFPSSGFPSKYSPGFFDAAPLRSRRSIVQADYLEPEAAKAPTGYSANGVSTPKEMIPGMFGPFGPFKPYAAVTDLPIPKSTIVPADFWLPSSIIPGPTEYTEKVSTFLQKLFDNLNLNKTAGPVDGGADSTFFTRSLIEDPNQDKTPASRSVDDANSLSAAKDVISDSIIAELAEIKADMISALNDYIVYEKTAAFSPGAKKPLKPISPFAAFFAKPTVDPALPFKQRITVLSQVFDMLTELHKNVTLAVQDAIKVSNETPAPQDPQFAQPAAPKTNFFSADNLKTFDYPATNPNAAVPLNGTFFEPSKPGLSNNEKLFVTAPNNPILPADFQAALNARILSNYLTPLWGSRPDAPTAKRNVDNDYQEIADSDENDREQNRDQYKRLVHMNMHQGYQSMPPGTIESVQAGGGSVPGHQGGGIKLLDQQKNDEDWSKWAEWAEQFKSENQGRKHHHNRH